MSAEPPIEPIPVPTIFATGIGPSHVEGEIVYMTLVAEQCRLDEPGTQRVVSGRLVMTKAAVAASIPDVMDLIGIRSN